MDEEIFDLAEWLQAELQLVADRLAGKPECHSEWVELVELIDRVQMMTAEYACEED